ncbi:hypothetical protein AGMMS4957_21310 [Bacteroidia bacterium]|nr:hypothetical protein AGMMS4957_21310 [Bacteroidia bacterium]
MKRYITLVLLLLLSIRLVAQDMSIEFSIEWKDKLDFQFEEIKNENISPAFFNITYRNISNRPLYCLKITEGKSGLPQIIDFHYAHGWSESKSMLNINDDYYKRRYYVGLTSLTSFYNIFSWDVRNDTTDIEYKIIKETWERPIVDIMSVDDNGKRLENDDFGRVIGGDTVPMNDWLSMTLDNIYNYIYWNYYSEQQKAEQNNKKQLWHYPSDITQDTIMNNSIDKFVFLQSGETYVDKYNLIGFQITGGTFTFQMDDTKSLDYVEMEPVKKADGTYESPNPTKQLPQKVGEYKLFTGEFLTNRVSVQFPGIKLKK